MIPKVMNRIICMKKIPNKKLLQLRIQNLSNQHTPKPSFLLEKRPISLKNSIHLLSTIKRSNWSKFEGRFEKLRPIWPNFDVVDRENIEVENYSQFWRGATSYYNFAQLEVPVREGVKKVTMAWRLNIGKKCIFKKIKINQK